MHKVGKNTKITRTRVCAGELYWVDRGATRKFRNRNALSDSRVHSRTSRDVNIVRNHVQDVRVIERPFQCPVSIVVVVPLPDSVWGIGRLRT